MEPENSMGEGASGWGKLGANPMGRCRLCDGERLAGRASGTVGLEESCGAGKGGVVTKEERLMCAQGTHGGGGLF